MKKIVPFLVLLVMLLSACGGGEDLAAPSENMTIPAASQSKEAEAGIVQKPGSGTQGTLQILSREGLNNGAGVNGYYERIESGFDDGSSTIVFTNYATGQRKFLCDEAGCSHNHNACIGWLPSANMQQQLFFMGPKGNTLFYIGNSITSNDSETVYVYAYDLNQSNRRELCALTSGEIVEGVIAANDTHLYLTVLSAASSEDEMKQEIRKIDMENGSMNTVAELNEGEWMNGAFADQLVIIRLQGTNVSYLLQSLSTAERIEAYTYTNSDDVYVELLGDKLFVVRKNGEAQGDAAVVDLSTGEETALYSGLPFFGSENIYPATICKDLVIFNINDNRQTDNTIHYCFALSLTDFEMKEITLTYQRLVDTVPIRVLADAGEHLLVVTGHSESGSRSITGNDGVPYDIPVQSEKRALISKADYLANNANFTFVDDMVLG